MVVLETCPLFWFDYENFHSGLFVESELLESSPRALLFVRFDLFHVLIWCERNINVATTIKDDIKSTPF